MSRKIDALVAERVMGYKWYRHKALTHEVVLALPIAYFEDGNLWEHNRDTRPSDERDSGNAPHYSTDISAAWEVVEKMRELGFKGSIGLPDDAKPPTSYNGDLFHVTMGKGCQWQLAVVGKSHAVEKAICLAALRAVGVTESQITEAL